MFAGSAEHNVYPVEAAGRDGHQVHWERVHARGLPILPLKGKPPDNS